MVDCSLCNRVFKFPNLGLIMSRLQEFRLGVDLSWLWEEGACV